MSTPFSISFFAVVTFTPPSNSILNFKLFEVLNSSISLNKNRIKRENGYIMITEKKYERDKWLERCFFILLLLIEFIRGYDNKPPKL